MQEIEIIIESKTDKSEELVRTCQMISDQALHESGCLKSAVLQDRNNMQWIFVTQHWAGLDQLNDYFRSNHFTALLGAMSFLARNHQIKINNGTPEQGELAVKKARQPVSN